MGVIPRGKYICSSFWMRLITFSTTLVLPTVEMVSFRRYAVISYVYKYSRLFCFRPVYCIFMNIFISILKWLHYNIAEREKLLKYFLENIKQTLIFSAPIIHWLTKNNFGERNKKKKCSKYPQKDNRFLQFIYIYIYIYII